MSLIQRIGVGFAFLLLVSSCKKNFDDYYERPANLEPPIYQVLESRGKFTKLLALIDKAGYRQTLSSGGYWTLFAPTDSAFNTDQEFKQYLLARNISSIDAIDSTTAQSIVQFLLVFNAFNRDRIDDYQSNLGWVPNTAFKRRTAYYTGFYNDTTFAGQPVKAIASNRNNTGSTNSYFVPADNNNKHIPFFTSEFFQFKGLTASDYNFFYPNTSFSGFNVVNARVNDANIAAENGVIHTLDRVVTPLLSLDQYLRTKPEFRVFRELMERFMVQFLQSADATRRYQVLTGKPDNVYVKVYSNLLAFSLNNENFFKQQDNDAQRDGWTLFAPANEPLNNYIDSVLLVHYNSVNSLPLNIVADLLNAHLWQTTVWPSKFNSTYNFLGEPVYSNASNILDRQILSNGFFYGTNRVNEPNVFSTIYGRAYLNPKYSIMTRLLNTELRNIITNPGVKFTMFMMSDSLLNAKGYDYNLAANAWTYTNPATGATSSNDSNRLNLLRILNTSVVETRKGELDNLGMPGFSGIINTYGGEYIQYNGNQIITAGTRDRNLVVTIDSIQRSKNGQVVYVNDLLYFTYTPIGKHLENLGTPTTSEFNLFWNYLRNSTMYEAATRNIVGTSAGAFYTIFVPNNAAVRQAITDGLLPGTVATPLFNPTTTADKLKVEKFIQYHILDKKTVASDGVDEGAFPTLLKNAVGDPVSVTINQTGIFEVSDFYGRKARLVPGQSNYLSNRTMIHLIDTYLKY